MSKKIDDFFNAYPGLDLIQNPKKCRRAKWFGRENGNGNGNPTETKCQTVDTVDTVDTVELYRKEMLKHLESFTIPLAHHKKTDCLYNLLEAGYHYFLNQSAPKFSDLEKIDSGGSTSQDNNRLSDGKIENIELDDQNTIVTEVLDEIIEGLPAS